MTYGGQGCGKSGIIKWQHAIIYTGKDEPAPRDNERPAEGEYSMMAPIRVRPASKQGKLDPLSRINFGKIYTVEHNVKAYNFGDVHEDFIKTLKVQWKYVLDRDMEGRVEEEEDDDDDDDEEEDEPSPVTYSQWGRQISNPQATPSWPAPASQGEASTPATIPTGTSKGKAAMKPLSEAAGASRASKVLHANKASRAKKESHAGKASRAEKESSSDEDDH
jgi:hypothetical protein